MVFPKHERINEFHMLSLWKKSSLSTRRGAPMRGAGTSDESPDAVPDASRQPPLQELDVKLFALCANARSVILLRAQSGKVRELKDKDSTMKTP